MNNDILVVYNISHTFGKDKTDHYIDTINSILGQDNYDQNYNRDIDYRLVISARRNYIEQLNNLLEEFGDRIDIIRYEDVYTSNVTFNKTVQECIKKYGNFRGYLYVDSGVILNNRDVIKNIFERMKNSAYSMITVQTNISNGFLGWLGFDYVKSKDFIVPVGEACNLHCQLFMHDLYNTYDKRIIPDVFRAYCTESVFSFLNAAIRKKWVIIKDIIVNRTVEDDRCNDFNTVSEKFGNSWNNLLFDRDATSFIKDSEAINAGLGYEEIYDVMRHRKDMYDENGASLDPKNLKKIILKYFFLNKEELDYDQINFWSIEEV